MTKYYYAKECTYGPQYSDSKPRRFTSKEARDAWVKAGAAYQGPGWRETAQASEFGRMSAQAWDVQEDYWLGEDGR